jgi:hyperosmotically inducible periplasmic protein
MIKTCVMTAAVAAWAFAGGAFARPAIQEAPKATTAVVKDEAGGKSKKAADKTASAAKTGGDVTDATITTEVKARLMKDKVGRAASIDVDSKAGVVTITGSVPSGSDVVRIGRLVETTKGVKSVVNDLTIGKK